MLPIKNLKIFFINFQLRRQMALCKLDRELIITNGTAIRFSIQRPAPVDRPPSRPQPSRPPRPRGQQGSPDQKQRDSLQLKVISISLLTLIKFVKLISKTSVTRFGKISPLCLKV